jgi:hypothetical protein
MRTGYPPLSLRTLARQRGAPGLIRGPAKPEPARGGR